MPRTKFTEFLSHLFLELLSLYPFIFVVFLILTLELWQQLCGHNIFKLEILYFG
jgi:hypothetical protein